MRSMTGFGLGEAPLDAGKLSCELRALNHRFLEVRVRVPDELGEHAFFVEQLARERLSRGRYDVTIRLETSGGAARFSTEKAKRAYASLLALRDEIAPGEPVPFSMLASLPELLTQSGSPPPQSVHESARAAFESALERLHDMQRREGQALAAELRSRLESVRNVSQRLRALGKPVLDSARQRLRDRVERLLAETGVHPDPGRLETELALLAERSDVTEELVRLDSHLDQLEALLAATEPVGRRMEFLLQELAREANTLGAKSQDVRLSALVVEMKAELEKIREQVQNVE